MRSVNYVVDMTPDFEEVQYRVRPIDFDQQSYEGRRKIYLAQFFADNFPVVDMVMNLLNQETIEQYQKEERERLSQGDIVLQREESGHFSILCLMNSFPPLKKLNSSIRN